MPAEKLVEELEAKLLDSNTSRDERIRTLWRDLDPHGTGELDLKGLRIGLRRLDHPLKNASGMLQSLHEAVDTNGDGKIQYEEFRQFVHKAEQQLLLLFHSIDHDRNGKLEKAELQKAFRCAGLSIPNRRLSQFFDEIDLNNDGFISFDEWRDFLLFMPSHDHASPMHAVLSFYSSIVTVNPEGDSMVSEETLEGIGYFVAGALAGGISRTATAPLDRLKVYLLVNTKTPGSLSAGATPVSPNLVAKTGSRPLGFLRSLGQPVGHAVKDLWRSGGFRTFFAGNGLNVIKIMPETAIKFGSYEFAKRTLAQLEGHDDPKAINSYSKFAAGGIAGMIAQFSVYPLDTLKFRLQCETVKGGPTGTLLLTNTAKKMYASGGIGACYRGITMGLVGMFPYSAIDMGTFEFLKTSYKTYRARNTGIHEEDVEVGNIMTGVIGASSGAFGATVVYPLNVLRTRLQTQGTKMHPPTYIGIWDVTVKTMRNEGVRGMYKGLVPNLAKVAPALSITWIVYENSKSLLELD